MGYKKILDCVDIINNRVNPYDGVRFYLDTGGLQVNQIKDTWEFDFDNKPSRANQNVQTNDIILARMKETTKVKVISDEESELMVSTGFIVLRARKNIVNVSYLNHILLSDTFQRDKDKLCTGATQKAINNTNFKKLNIFLPPLYQQKQIASILDAAEVYRQNTKALIDKYELLSQSLFLDMFGDPVTNPKKWNFKTLDESLEFLTSGSRGWAKYYNEEGSIFLRIQNVGYNELRLDDITHVDAPKSAESKRTKVQGGDLLLTITADLGRTAVIPENFPPANINQHLALLRLKDIYDPIFVSSYIASRGGQSKFTKLDKGGVKAGLNFNDIRSYEIFDVPFSLQVEFKARFEAIEKQKELVKRELDKSEELFNSLLQKAFKGELVK